MHDRKRHKNLKAIRLLAAGSLVAMPIKACSGDKSSFAELKISEESQSSYNVYEKIKDDLSFKSQFEEVLKRDIGDAQDQQVKSLIVNGVKFENAGQRLELSKKVYNRGYKGTFGEQLKEYSKNLGAVQPRDFQISQEILHDTLKASGERNQLQGLLKKYSDEDYRRAFRATMIMKAYERLVRESDKKANLNLVNPAAVAAGGEALKTVVATLPDLIKNINDGKWIDANGAAIRSCSKEIDTCSDALKVSFNTKGQENFNSCETSGKPNASCNVGLVRDQNEKQSGSAGWSNSFLGEGTCSAHRWRCYCAAAFEKRNGTNDYLHTQYDKYSCGWEYNKEEKPDRPEVANLNDALKVCEAKTRCSVSVSVGKTN